MTLSGQVALVTGAASGIGRAIATALVAEGAQVVIADLDEVRAQQVAAELGQGKARACRVDVTDSQQADAAIRAAVDAFGRLTILVNNAGIGLNKPIVEITDDEWELIIAVILHGAFYCARAAARQMIAQEQGGKIVNIASTVAGGPRPNSGPYCAAKAGIVALTSVLAMELGPHGINVNCVGPGLTDTPLMRRSATDTYRENFLKQVPLGRMAQPADIADVVAFLCSPAARYVSGQTLFVDGGYLAGKYTSHG
jgi:NAD(P)-dependent dehydrogenase (short-subunit alcohol dehydrogenase family)